MRAKVHALCGSLVICCIAHCARADGALERYDAPSDAAATMVMSDLGGRTHRLHDYEGNVLLLNFWATWCSPCLTEMPGMQRLVDSFSDRPFNILAINIGEPKARIQSMLERLGVNFTVLLDPDGRAMSAWQAQVLPTSFIADRAGRVRYRVVGPFEWDGDEAKELVEQLLREEAAAENGTGQE